MYQRLNDLLEERIGFLKGIIDRTKNAEEIDPGLSVKSCGGERRPQLYMKDKVTDDKFHYVSKRMIRKARRIVQRDYLLEVRECAQKELSYLEECKKRAPGISFEELVDTFPRSRRLLITPLILSDDDYAAEWQSREYPRMEFYENERKYKTERGELVRSKSELMIANFLFKEKVPYHYEAPLEMGKKTLFPDFTVLNRRTRKEYYWEHLGRFDSPGYVERNLGKIAAYTQAGVLPGVELILTFEGEDVAFGPRVIEGVVRHYLTEEL